VQLFATDSKKRQTENAQKPMQSGGSMSESH